MNINTNAVRFLIAPPRTFFQIVDLDSRNVMIHQQFVGEEKKRRENKFPTIIYKIKSNYCNHYHKLNLCYFSQEKKNNLKEFLFKV